MTTVTPASLTRDQNGSKRVSKGFFSPSVVGTAAGRITIVRAPRSSAHSSSRQAHPTSARLRYGAA